MPTKLRKRNSPQSGLEARFPADKEPRGFEAGSSLQALEFGSFYCHEVEAQPGASFTQARSLHRECKSRLCVGTELRRLEATVLITSAPRGFSLRQGPHRTPPLSTLKDGSHGPLGLPEDPRVWDGHLAAVIRPGDLQGLEARARYRGDGPCSSCCALRTGLGSSRRPAFTGTESCWQLSAVCPRIGTCSPPDTPRGTPHAH